MTRTQWLPELPRDWRVARLQHLAATATSNVDKHSVDGQTAVRLCNYVDVYKNDAITPDMDLMPATATPEQIARFALRRGDVVITKDSETSDDIGVPAFVADSARDLVCGYHLSIVRPRERVTDPRFLYWLLESDVARTQWSVLATGVTRVGLKTGDIARLQVPFPPLPEQRAVADYLDRETAQIDTLIKEQQRLIDLALERSRSQVAEQIDGWPLVPLRRAIGELRQGWSPNCEPWPADGVTDWAVLKVGCSNTGAFEPGQNKRLPDDETPRPELAVRKGEVIMSRANTKDLVGAAAVVDADYPRLMLSDLNYGLTTNHLIDAQFLAISINSGLLRHQISAASKGTSPSMQKISQRDIRELLVPVPPRSEQAKIVSRVSRLRRTVNELVSEAERLVELSRERRAALITAAVTGQFDLGVSA